MIFLWRPANNLKDKYTVFILIPNEQLLMDFFNIMDFHCFAKYFWFWNPSNLISFKISLPSPCKVLNPADSSSATPEGIPFHLQETPSLHIWPTGGKKKILSKRSEG